MVKKDGNTVEIKWVDFKEPCFGNINDFDEESRSQLEKEEESVLIFAIRSVFVVHGEFCALLDNCLKKQTRNNNIKLAILKSQDIF